MILFINDWDEFPDAIPDYKTTNTSFLELAALLKKMGVKNHFFFLALHQPELQGVDPYALDLTLEQKQMIALECEFNPWYFLREIMRVPPNAGIDPVPFRANRANISMIWCFLNHLDYMLIQPRQTGKSVSTDALMSWLYLFVVRNARIFLITKDELLRVENVNRLRNIRGFLPEWLVVNDKTDANNSYMLTYNTRGNRYLTGVGQNSEDGARKLGRGASVPIIHIDESPFIPYIDVTIPTALSSGNAARDEAARNGQPYANVFTTTAGKIDSRSGGYMYDIYEGGATWNEMFYDAGDEKSLHEIVRKANKGRKQIVVGVFSHRQLGYSDAWLYEKISNSGATDEEADRDYFNRWTRGSSGSPLTVQQLTAIMHSEMDPMFNWISQESYIMRWYIDELELQRRMKSTSFIMGLDTSDAIGRDDIAFTVIDASDLSVVGRATINDTYIPNVAKWASTVLQKYPNITLVIEKKSSAQTFIDTLLVTLPSFGIDPFERVFNRIVDDRLKYEKEYHEISKTPIARRNSVFYERYRNYFGFITTGSSRELLYSKVLINAAKRAGALVRDRELSGQIRGLIIKNGRLDHSAAGHDDAVMSWLLAQWLLMYGKNLSYYGIDVSKINLRVGADGEIATPAEIAVKEQRVQIKAELEKLVEQLVCTDLPMLVIQYEGKIKRLMEQLDRLPGEDSVTFDAIMQEAKERRSQALRNRRRAA